MLHRAFSSLRVRLLALVLLAVLPALALLLDTTVEQRQAAEEAVRLDAQRLAQLVVHDHQSVIQEAAHLLTGFSHLPRVRGMDPGACARNLRPLLAGYPRFLNFGVLRADGSLLCSVRELRGPFRASPGLKEAFAEAARTGRLATSGYTMGEVSGQPLVMLAHRARNEQGVTTAVVYAALRLDWLERLAIRAGVPEGATLLMTDARGTVLLSHPDAGARAGGSIAKSALFSLMRSRSGGGLFPLRDPAGVARLYAAAPVVDHLGRTRAYLAIGIPAERAYAAADRSLRRNLAWLTSLAALALLAAWYGGHFFVLRRVNALVAATRRLHHGDLSTRTGIAPGPGELEQLAGAFDEMAAALQARAEALRESEERFRNIFEHSTMGIVQGPLPHGPVAANPAMQRLIGVGPECTVEEILERTHPDDREEDLHLLGEVVAGRSEHYRMEKRYVTPEGEVVWAVVTIQAVRGLNGEPGAAFGIVENITDRRRAEEALARSQEELRHAQKMEAVGRLAGGVAHDFNNLLTAIKGNVELALLDLPASSPLREDLEQVLQASDTAASLTRQLLAFSRRQSAQPLQTVDMNATVEATAQLLRRMIGTSVQLATRVEEASRPIRLDTHQLEQILINLAVNGRDAMPGGGRLEIQSRGIFLGEADPQRPAHLPAGEYAELVVRDNGTGIDPEVQRRIFEPFFTTKDRERGTGLGLFMVYGIVTQNGGHIAVESAPGRGTTFRILFPCVDAHAEAKPWEQEGSGSLMEGEETILLVDDEAPVRQLALRLLERTGYRVLLAGSAEEALRVSAAHPEPIHLLLTDVTMPGMSGKELGERITTARPETRVVYMSGYTEETLPAERSAGTAATFLQKPFTLTVLARTVRDALDAPEEALV